MATRSMPMVSCRSRACAMASLVPTPSVEVASTGCGYLAQVEAEQPGEAAEAAERPRAGRCAATAAFISSTARSPASMSTPAAA